MKKMVTVVFKIALATLLMFTCLCICGDDEHRQVIAEHVSYYDYRQPNNFGSDLYYPFSSLYIDDRFFYYFGEIHQSYVQGSSSQFQFHAASFEDINLIMEHFDSAWNVVLTTDDMQQFEINGYGSINNIYASLQQAGFEFNNLYQSGIGEIVDGVLIIYNPINIRRNQTGEIHVALCNIMVRFNTVNYSVEIHFNNCDTSSQIYSYDGHDYLGFHLAPLQLCEDNIEPSIICQDITIHVGDTTPNLEQNFSDALGTATISAKSGFTRSDFTGYGGTYDGTVTLEDDDGLTPSIVATADMIGTYIQTIKATDNTDNSYQTTTRIVEVLPAKVDPLISTTGNYSLHSDSKAIFWLANDASKTLDISYTLYDDIDNLVKSTTDTQVSWTIEMIGGFENYNFTSQMETLLPSDSRQTTWIASSNTNSITLNSTKSGIYKVTVSLEGNSDYCYVVIPGDVNRDSYLRVADGTTITRYALSFPNITGATNDDFTKPLADMNGDKYIRAADGTKATTMALGQ